MAKTLVRNKLGNITKTLALPCDAKTAKTFCDNVLDGEYIVLEEKSKEGNKTETQVVEMSVTCKATDGKKAMFSLYAKPTVDATKLLSALKGKTINGIVVEEVFAYNVKIIDISSGS